MAWSRTQPLKGIPIQTAPAPLLGLQHVATLPGGRILFYWLEMNEQGIEPTTVEWLDQGVTLTKLCLSF